MGYIKKLKNNELVGGTDKTTIYPVTSTEAVFEEITEGSESNFKSQKFLNNNITGDRINKETITDYNIAKGTLSEEKLNTELKTKIQQGVDSSWTPKGDYNAETLYNANDLVYDNNTLSSYLSLKADNVGHSVEDTEWWMKVLNGSYIHQIEADAEAEIDAALEDARAATTLANNAAENANTVSEKVASDVEDAIESLGQQISELIEDQGTSATTIVTEPTDTDGVKPVQNYVIGRAIKKSEDYLTNDLKTLAAGANYSAKESVITSSKQILRITQDVRFLNLTDTVKQGELKTYNNATYQAQEDVKEFANTSLVGASVVEPVYALGSPTKLSLNIERGNCNINASFTNGTEIVGNEVNITPTVGYTSTIIATAVYDALTALGDTGWTFADKGNGSITAEYPASDGYSDYNIIFSESSGITSTSIVSVTDSSTKITMTFSVGVGTISATFKGVSYDISVGATTTSSQVATSIAEAFEDVEGWVFESSGNTVSATCLEAGNNSSTEFKLTDGVLGVTYTLSKPWTGSNTISHFDGTDWTIDTLATYSSSIVFSSNETIDEAWLISNVTEPDSLTKEIVEDEYVISNAFNKQKEDYEKKIIDDEYVIARAVGDHEIRLSTLEGGDGSSKYSGTISTSNSDTICIFGCSFDAPLHYVDPTSKLWVYVMDQFSDYTFRNFSIDGCHNVRHILRLRNKSDVMPQSTRFALLVNSANLGLSKDYYYKSFVELAKVIRSFGVEPIIGSSFGASNFNQAGCYYISLLRKWCKDTNTIFMNAAEYCSVNGMNTAAHPNARETASTAYAFMDALAGLESPRQSMKLYKVRTGVDTSSLDNLMFGDNYERARRFVPVTATSFSQFALISVVLPATSNCLERVRLNFKSNVPVEVYCMDSDATPYYTENTTYTRFHINEECVAEAGDIYKYNGQNFNIIVVRKDNEEHYGAFCDLYCTPSLGSGGSIDGTLTKVSGSGSSTINFNGYAQTTLGNADALDDETGGHWAELQKEEGKDRYPIPDIMTKVFYDKVFFLIKSEGSFTLNGLFVEWGASKEKDVIRTTLPDFTSNLFNPNEELVTEATFGEVGNTLSSWTDAEGTAITTVSSGNRLPNGCNSCVVLSSDDSMSCTVPVSKFRYGHLVMEILACYNPSTLTVDSWDWNKLNMTLTSDSESVTYSLPVGLSWKILRIPIDIITCKKPFKDLTIKLFPEFNNMQIAKVSLKYI